MKNINYSYFYNAHNHLWILSFLKPLLQNEKKNNKKKNNRLNLRAKKNNAPKITTLSM